MRLMLIKKVERILREGGFLVLLRRMLFSYSSTSLMENDLDRYIVCKVEANTILKIITNLEEFDELVSNDFDVSLSWYEMSIQQCRERLSNGAILFLVFVENEASHASWVGTTKRTHGDFYYSPIDYEHEASIGGTMTDPKYRGIGIYTWVYSQIFHYLRDRGYSKALFEVDRNNVAVQKAQAKLGSNIRGESCCVRFLLFKLRWVKPEA